MEMQFFVKPGTEMEWYEYWKNDRLKWHLALGLSPDFYRFKDHTKLAHYANAACDIEFKFPFGFKELEGIHSRTDFDLSNHEKYSGKKLQYFDPEENKSYVPYVVETSVGLDRLFLAIFSSAYKEEMVENETRTVLSIPPALAPVKAAVFPLVKKDGMPEIAQKLWDELKFLGKVIYEDKDTIGRRYRRQDAIGTPYCITIDNETLQNETVTVRERDTMQQERMHISKVYSYLEEKTSIKTLLQKL
jgi:glycyl-tRNA synthetase